MTTRMVLRSSRRTDTVSASGRVGLALGGECPKDSPSMEILLQQVDGEVIQGGGRSDQDLTGKL